jgi:aryl-alcohol dehydrogenase-like predicted oxidoreductase
MGKFDLSRRQFMGALALGTAHLMFKNPLYGATGRFTSADPLQFVPLGKSGLNTTLIGFGTGVWAGNRTSFLTRQEKDKSIGLLRHAYDRGFRMFDCADTYGTHGIMAEALKSMDREKMVITSKMWTRKGGIPEDNRPDADVVVERFRKELDIDYIDLVQIHCMVDEGWTDSERKQMDILDNLKAKGIIRAHGVSVHSLEAMKTAADDPWVDVLHARINPYGIAMDKPDPEEVVEVIHKLHAAGKGVIGMKLVGNGEYTDSSEKIDHSIRFVLGLGSVDMMIVGFENEGQVNNYMDRVGAALTVLSA